MTDQAVAMSCALCGRRWSASFTKPHMEQCPGCSVLTTVPPPQRDVFSDDLFEDGSYGGRRLARRKQWFREAGKRLDWIRSYVRNGALLEIGSATGEFVAMASKAGFQVVGLEASEWATTASRDLTTHVHRADPVVWLREHGGRFNVIVFFHTLEHVHEPRLFLEPLVAALAPAGYLFIEVPNGAARDVEDGEDWLGARFPDHVLHYREDDLRALLRSVGLEAVAVTTHTMRDLDSPVIWALRRLRWLTKAKVRPSRDILRVVARHQ